MLPFNPFTSLRLDSAMVLLLALALCPFAVHAQSDDDKPPEAAVQIPTLYQLYPPAVNAVPTTPEAGPDYSDPWAVEDGYGRSRIAEVPGESVDPRTGAVTLTVTDLSIPGNGGLDIVVSRTRRDSFFVSPGPDYLENRSFQDTMADWRLDVPFIQLRSTGAYDQDVGGIMPQSPVYYSDNPATCESPFPGDPFQTTGFNPPASTRTALFGGVQLAGMPGGGGAELLLRSVNGNDTERTRARQLETPYGTADQLVVQCGASTLDAIRPGARSAFSVHTPDGSTYHFAEPSSGNNLSISPVEQHLRPWGHVRVYLSQIRNRHGKTLNYQYDAQPEIQAMYPYVNGVRRPDRRDHAYLTSITADDGREVRFTWECNPYGKGRSLGLANCGTNQNTYHGAPLFRLRSMTANGRTWIYEYNDTDPAGPDQSRFLKSVRLPNAQRWTYARQQVSATPPGACGRYPYGFASGIDYTVTHPEGGVAVYKTRPRRIIRYNSCRYVTSLAERVVTPNPALAESHTTRWCLQDTVQGSSNPVWTHILGPTRMESMRFQRELESGDKWKEGLLLESRVYEPIAACPTGEPPANFVERTSYEYQRGDRITEPTSSVFPSYAESINAPRPVTKVRIERPDTGTFETSHDQFDRYFRPQLSRESLVGQLSTATSARRWKSTPDHRAVRLIVYPAAGQFSLNWLVPTVDSVDVKYSVNGGAEQNAATGSNSSGSTSISRSAGVPYSIRIYPAGQSGPGARLAEVNIPAGDMQQKYEFRWLLDRQKRRCVVASDGANCATSEGILQAREAEFDVTGNLLRETDHGVTRSYAYSADGDVAAATDARGYTTQYQNYYRGVPRNILLPGTDGASRSLMVNATGTIQSITDGEGYTTSFDYDERDRLRTVTFPIGTPLSITRTPDGRTRTSTQGSAVRISTFDGFGRLLSEEHRDSVDASNNFKVSTRYDAAGRTTFQSDPHAPATGQPAGMSYAHDALDRQRSATRSSNSAVSVTDFLAPETILQSDANTHTRTLEYRSFGAPSNEQLMKSFAPVTLGTDTWQSQVGVEFVRDTLGFASSLTSGRKGVQAPNVDVVQHRYRLDGRRLLVDEFLPELGAAAPNGYNIGYCRDAAGNMTGKSLRSTCVTAASANWVRQTFDERNRLTLVDFVDPNTPDTAIEYDKNDQIRRTTKGSVVIDIVRNEMGAPRFVTHTVEGKVFRMEYRYNTSNQLRSIVYPSGKEYELQPDAFGRATRIGSVVTDIDYHQSGMVKKVTYGNGVIQNWSPTNELQIDTITAQRAGSAAILNLDYAYDLVGNTTGVLDSLRADSMALGYDELDRVKWTQYASGGQIPRRYDAVGNVTHDEGLSFFYDRSTASTHGSNRLTGSAGIPGRGTLSYDPYGNMTSDGARTLEFGADGTLRRSTQPVVRQFSYDGNDRVVVQSEADGTRRYRVYAGENVVMEYDPQSRRILEHLYLGSLLVGTRVVDNPNPPF
ncbi:MAG: hypothetical protein OMOMHJEC_03043 [Xanthomonadales bacterium]|nr:hypothetical protein [Xanthomonadales bacterium]